MPSAVAVDVEFAVVAEDFADKAFAEACEAAVGD
jgi:hypothetical protein